MTSMQNAAARYTMQFRITNLGIGPKLINGEVHRWDGCVWREATTSDLYQLLTDPNSPVQLMSSSAVDGAIKILRNIIPHGDAPLSGVACRNGFVSIDIETGAIRLLPHHPDQHQTWMLGIDYDQAARAPLWRQTLLDVLSPWCIPALQEGFGVAIMGLGPRYERAFALPGSGENGRSTILTVLRSLFDPSVVKSIPPQSWSRLFLLADLAGARLNVVAEMPAKEIMDSERFKTMITGRDLITAERKNRDPFGFVPIATHLFAPNELPYVADQTHGFWRRWIVIPFVKKIITPDRYRDQRIIQNELAGVLAWAIEGARRLVVRGDYRIARAMEDRKAEWRLKVDHVLRFIEEKCTRLSKPHDGMKAEDLHAVLHEYLIEQHLNAISAPIVGERLKAILGPGGWKRESNGIWYGIKVTDEDLLTRAILLRDMKRLGR